MALFAPRGVLRGFSAAAYPMYAFLSRCSGTANPCACPVKCGAYFTGAALRTQKLLVSGLDTYMWVHHASWMETIC
jgi:hypothetical protein